MRHRTLPDILIDVPEAVLDGDAVVAGSQLKDPLDLHHGAGGAIEAS